jgi:hypothetical protein
VESLDGSSAVGPMDTAYPQEMLSLKLWILLVLEAHIP